MFLRGANENPNALIGKFSGVVLKVDQLNDRSVKPVKYADYIAECNGQRSFPLRVTIISADISDMSLRLKKIIAKTPMARFGDVKELNGIVHYLCNDVSKFVTGTVIPVDGGFSSNPGYPYHGRIKGLAEISELEKGL